MPMAPLNLITNEDWDKNSISLRPAGQYLQSLGLLAPAGQNLSMGTWMHLTKVGTLASSDVDSSVRQGAHVFDGAETAPIHIYIYI